MWTTATFSEDPQIFIVDVLAPRSFCYGDVLWPIRYGAVRKRTLLFYTRHAIFFLTSFSVDTFSVGDLPVISFAQTAFVQWLPAYKVFQVPVRYVIGACGSC